MPSKKHDRIKEYVYRELFYEFNEEYHQLLGEAKKKEYFPSKSSDPSGYSRAYRRCRVAAYKGLIKNHPLRANQLREEARKVIND